MEYAEHLFSSRLQLVRIFSGLMIVNVIYTGVIRYNIVGYMSLYYKITTFGVILPFTIATIVLGNISFDINNIWYIIKYVVIGFNSIMFGFIIQLRSYLCHFDIDVQCQERALVNEIYLYILAGPALTLFIYSIPISIEACFMGILALFLIVTDAQIDNSLVYFDIAILCFYMFLKYIARFHRVIEYNNWENERTQSKLIKKNHDLEMATHNFASYIHHEINNPLNNASLLLSQLQLDDDDKCPEYKQIINDIHSIKHVMDDASWFLDMVKSDIHVDDIAGDVLTMINDIRKIFQYSENVTWEVSNEGHNNIFLPSMNRIKKVLIILIRNLLSTYNDGYSVHIDARFQERIVTINIVQKPLLQEHQPPIAYHNDAAKMEDHARWDNLSRNLALGILQVNNCDTDIQFSVPGQVIGIKLICVGILEEQSVPPPIIVENHRSTTMHILIVDDNSITRKLIGRFLTTTNYTYEEACDGIECIEKLSKTAFDLIILDTVMPNLGGKGVLQYMINNEIYTPVISISANSSPSDVAELTELGVLQVLGKPIIFEKLQEYIKNVEDK